MSHKVLKYENNSVVKSKATHRRLFNRVVPQPTPNPVNRGCLALLGCSLALWLLVGKPALAQATAEVTGQDSKQGVESNATTTRYRGKPISISARKLPLRDFFRLITELSALNVVVHPDITGYVNLEIANVPWDQVLHIVAADKQLVPIQEGTILYIIPAAKVAEFYRH